MPDILNNLKNILNEEKTIFRNIYKLEEEKSEAIIQRDGNLLQTISNSSIRTVMPAPILSAMKTRDVIRVRSQKT